jgi:hypothetical protein
MMFLKGGLILALVVAGAYATLVFSHPDQKDGAAWIQCVWSVVAAMLAVIVPSYYADVQAHSDYRRHREMLSEVVGSAEKLLKTAAGWQGDFAQFQQGHPLAVWAAVRDSLVHFPVGGLKHADEVQDLMIIRGVMAEACEMLELARGGKIPWPGFFQRCGHLLESADAAFRSLRL